MSVPTIEVQGLKVPLIPPPVVENFRPLPVVPPLNYQLAPPITNTSMPALGPTPAGRPAPPEGVQTLRAVTDSVKNDRTVVITGSDPQAQPQSKSQSKQMEAAGPILQWRPPARQAKVQEDEGQPAPKAIKSYDSQYGKPAAGPDTGADSGNRQITLAGRPIEVPTARKVAELSLTAFIITVATLLTIAAVKKTQKALSLQIALIVRKRKDKKKKDKIKVKIVKPLIHLVRSGQGLADVLRYTQDEVEVLAEDVEPEAYLRKQIDEDGLYESLNQIVIDVTLKEAFTKEGLERFKYFIEPGKYIKKLRAKLSLLG